MGEGIAEQNFVLISIIIPIINQIHRIVWNINELLETLLLQFYIKVICP